MTSVADTVADAAAVEKKTRCAIYWKQRIWSLDRTEQLMGEQWRTIMDKQRVEAGYATVPWDIFDQLSVDEQQIAVTALLIGRDKKWKRRETKEWPVCVTIEEDEEGIARLLEVKEGEEIGVSEEEEEVEEKKEGKEEEEEEEDEEDEPPGKRARMQSALTTNTGNSVASRLKQCSLKKKLEDDSHLLSAFSPDFRRESDDAPRKKLTDGDRALIRVIAQYFQDLGLSETVQTLSKESRCKVENSHAVRLRSAIHETNWDDAVAIIDSCYDHLTPEHIETVRNILIEEKFFDLIRKQKRPLALHMLKKDFDPRNPMREPLMKLLFETDEDIFRQKAYEKYRPVKGGHRNTERICTRIQKVLPASFMLPTNRLQTLLDQAFETQVARCETHIHRDREYESRGEPSMLFEDHKCQKRDEKYFIETCMREDHKSEVWKVSFSPCGKFLATASFATVVYFWKVNPRTRQLEQYRKITARDTTHGISGMSWSADSKLLAVCGVDDHPYGMYIYDMHGDSLFTQIPHHEAHSFTCIDFFKRQYKEGHYHLTVGDLRGSIQFMEISRDYSNKINSYEGYRIRCVYSCKSGRGAYAADTHNRVRWYRNTWNNNTPTDHTVIREENTITNMSVHPSEQLMLLTTKILGLRMWNVQARTLLRTFQGYHDGGYVLNACFGGMNNEYIVTGSYTTDEYDDEGNVIRRPNENDCAMEETIRIWRLTDEYQICGIAGHRSTVNSVSWNPRDPFMIASGSDDHSIRLWSCRQEDLPQRFTEERHHLFSRSLRDVDTFKKEGETSAASAPVAIPKKEGENDETPIEDEEEDSDDSDGSTDSDDSDESGDDEDSSDDPSDYDYEDITDHEDAESISRDLVQRDRGEYRRIPIYDLFRAPDAGEAAEGDDEREEDEDIDEEEDVYYEDDGEERGEEVEREEREGEHDVEDEDEDEDDDDSSSPTNQSPN